MAQGDVHTYFEEGLWKNRVEGGSRASNTSLRRTDAIVSGRAMARKRRVVHVVHQAGGEVDTEKDFRDGARSRAGAGRAGEGSGSRQGIATAE